MPVENVIYNPINRANLNCGPSFSDQILVFGNTTGCEGIKIIKGAETKAVLPMPFTIPSASYMRNDIVLPKLGTLATKVSLNASGYTFLAFSVVYPSTIPDANKLIRCGFTEDFAASIFFPVHKAYMLSAPVTAPFTDFYMYNPNNQDVTVSYLLSK